MCLDSTFVIVPGHSTCRTQAQTVGEHGVKYLVLYDNDQNQSVESLCHGRGCLEQSCCVSELCCIMLDLDGIWHARAAFPNNFAMQPVNSKTRCLASTQVGGALELVQSSVTNSSIQRSHAQI